MSANLEFRRLTPARLPLLHVSFLAVWLLSILVFWEPLRQLVSLSLNDPRYSHLIAIPFISACLVWWRRRAVFHSAAWQTKIGVPLVLLACAFGWLFSLRALSSWSGLGLSVAALAALAAWAAGFLLCYGALSLKAARFPLLFLLVMVPVPPVLMQKIILTLQTGSAELVHSILNFIGTPMFRQGFTFQLPGIAIEVAEECSSIHSAWALFITSLLVGHLMLRSLPSKIFLSLLTPPIAVFTNAVRIVAIWLLATRVDSGFMYGNLHRDGGILFSLISLSILLSCVWLLRKLEGRAAPGTADAGRAEQVAALRV